MTAPSESRWIRLLESPKLGLWLAGLAVLLAVPSLFIGFYQDDFVARYIFSTELEGAKDLYRAYAGGYGISNGVPADNHWQAENGHAPWWILPNLRLALYRPISQFTHILDVRLWPDNAPIMHAHNLIWLAVLILAVTVMYRRALGALVGGLAALLFAFDYTHGFAVGYITNRHALISAVLGVLCLDQHFGTTGANATRARILGPLAYLLALLSGELSISVLGYVFAFTVLVDRSALKSRALTLAPYLLITLVWRVLYTNAGYGAYGSGVYVDLGREPLRFLSTFLERGPILLLGQFFAPPPEIAYLADARLTHAILILAIVFLVLFLGSLLPLLARNRMAWVWCGGIVTSLVPACSTFPHSRQLMFVSFGSMGLLAQLWHHYAVELRGERLSLVRKLAALPAAVVLFGHLFVSPLGLPLATCSVALARPFHEAVNKVQDDIAGRDVIFVNAPDCLAMRLVQLIRRVEHRPLARRWRGLSLGPQRVAVQRPDDHTLVVDYEGGILSTPLSELYRDRRLRMAPGDTVSLTGVSIRVRSVTDDGRVNSAEFAFDRPLDDPGFVFYFWGESGFEHFKLPAIGQSTKLPAPVVKL